jgi:hypothetical protein
MTDISVNTKQDVPPGFVLDRKGNLIKKELVKPIDKARDKLVRAIVTDAQKVNGALSDFKEAALVAVADFVDESAQKYNAKPGGQKGNMSLYTFDGEHKVEISISENKAFDERLQVAKSLIDECIKDWMKGSNKNIQALVQDAFRVDRQGKVSVERILGLRRLEIEDERWESAMDAIADSIQITSSKRYIRVYQRKPDGSGYDPIPLDAANA